MKTVTQLTWFVDPVNGDDHNSGLTAQTALKTVAELVNVRFGGPDPLFVGATTITFLNDSTEPLILLPHLLDAARLYLLGTLSQVGSGTLGPVTPKARAANTPLQADLGQSPTLFVGLLLQNVTKGGYAWVDRVNSGNVVTLTQPFASSVLPSPQDWPWGTSEIDTWAAGDSYKVWRPSQVNLVDFRPVCYGQTQNGVGTAPCFLGDFWVPQGADGVGNDTTHVSGGGFSVANHVRIDREVMVAPTPRSPEAGNWFSCYLHGGVRVSSDDAGAVFVIGGATYGVVGECVLDGDVLCRPTVSGGTTVVGSVIGFGNAFLDGQATFFRYAAVAPVLYPQGVLYGPGSLDVAPASTLTYQGTSAVLTFPLAGGITVQGAATTASAYDGAGTWHPGIALTPANLDLPAGPAGFGGAAIKPSLNISVTKTG